MIFRQLKVLLLTKRPGKCKRFKNRMTIWKKIYRLQPQLRINGKKKVAISFFVNKSKKDDEVDEKPEEEAGILEDFDYHDNINAESYEKYFQNICKLLKPNSVIIIDNASYHSRNADDFPVPKWKKSQFQDWLKDHKIPFRPDALRTELWMLCKIHRATNTSKVIDNIAKRYGHEVLRLPPYHCDLNGIELIWADEKNFVSPPCINYMQYP